MSSIVEAVKAKASALWAKSLTAAHLHNSESRAHDPTAADVASLLEYDRYDEATGLFYNDASVGMCFRVLPRLGTDGGIETCAKTIFASIPPGYGAQWVLFGSPNNDGNFELYVDERQVAVVQGLTTPFFHELAQRRVRYLRNSTIRGSFPNDDFLIRNIELVFSVTRSGSRHEPGLVKEMAELREVLRATLSSVNLSAFTMNQEDLINFLHPILDPAKMWSEREYEWRTADPNTSIREQLLRCREPARVCPDGMVFGEPDQADPDAEIQIRPFSILSFPEERKRHEIANVIGSLYDDALQYPCPFLITCGIYTLDSSLWSEAQLDGSDATRGDGRPCEMYHTLLLFAPRRIMAHCERVAREIWKQELFALRRADRIALSLLKASLPMTLTEHTRTDLVKKRIMNTKMTDTAVNVAPIFTEWRGVGDPVMMFFGRRGNTSFLDFYSEKHGNCNVFVAGGHRSGKTAFMNEVISSYRSIGARVWVIDTGRRYNNPIALQNGRFLEFTESRKICINPFSWAGGDSEVNFEEEMRLLQPLLARMASPNEPLSYSQYALIGEAATAAWNDYGQDTDPTKIASYLSAKIKADSGAIDLEARRLSKALEPFTKDGVYGAYFNGRATISMDGDLIGLGLEGLKNRPELRRVVLFALISRIAADMHLARDRKKLCLVDDAWQLLGEDGRAALFIEEAYRRARKYKGIFCLGADGIADAFENDAACAAFFNAGWKILLRQDREVLDEQKPGSDTNLSPEMKRMLLSLRAREGKYSELLIFTPSGGQIVRQVPDPFSSLMHNSKPDDFKSINEFIARGHRTIEALNVVLERQGIHA